MSEFGHEADLTGSAEQRFPNDFECPSSSCRAGHSSEAANCHHSSIRSTEQRWAPKVVNCPAAEGPLFGAAKLTS